MENRYQQAIEWPKQVPVLTADDMCKGVFHGPNGTRCLAGWMDNVFNDHAARYVARCAIIEIAGVDITAYNDNPRRKLSSLARTWNRAMARLGYTE